MAQFLRSTFHWPEEPGAHQGTWHLSGAAIQATVMLDSLSAKHLISTGQLTSASNTITSHASFTDVVSHQFL